jgi:hypothetical protein
MAIGRLSSTRLLATAFAVVGAYWTTVRALISANVDWDALPYIAHAVGAFVAGALVNAHVRVRASREPLLGGVLGIALMAVVFVVLPKPQFNWVAARAAQPWLVVAIIAGVSAVCAWAGAEAMLRLSSQPAHGAPPIVALGMFVSGGVVVLVGQAVTAFQGPKWGLVLGMSVAAFGGGHLTQSVVAERNPAAAGGGVAVLALLFFIAAAQSLTAQTIAYALVGALILTAIGAWGARVAWRARERRGMAPEVPSAQLERS